MISETGERRFKRRLVIEDRRTMEAVLDSAVDQAVAEAMTNSACGILVTRHDDTNFTVEVSEGVLSGMIVERDLRTRPSRYSS